MSPESALAYPRLRRAALGTALVFTANGSLMGAWASRLPSVRDNLDATPGQLGMALLAIGIGSILSMPVAGHVCRRIGSRNLVLVTMLVSCTAFAAVGFVESMPQLLGVLFAFGLVFGTWDVAMNIQGSAVELRAERAWMPRYHACWSVGTIIGAGFGALAAKVDMSVAAHFPAASLVCAAATIYGLSTYIEERTAATVDDTTGTPRKRSRVITGRLALIGVITLSATTIEGAATDWLAIFLVDERDASHASGALGFAMFAIAMAAGRFAGTPLTERLGRDRAVRVGGVFAVAGVLVTVLAPVLVLSYAGAVLWGLGVCLVFPSAISAAGETDRPQESIAMVSSLGYSAILLGPPGIGALADQFGLGRALLALLVLGVVVALFAPAVRVHRASALQ